MNAPETLKYHKEHTWLKVDGETGIIGITEFAQSELGEILYVDFPNMGNIYKQNETFGSVEALKTVSELLMPVTGGILELNANLKTDPTLINIDPFGAGWLVKVKIINAKEIDGLLSQADYVRLTTN